ncbi:hypothetical protein [Methylobacterium planeticum]|uniref:Uncharacterized protein n=1 Tax=Methylobacterium planeticum TaxID=2615211 RepID=A0A6N6MV21_9HYPH|nr:hypothetical protein [Methylobacterium planeticum]KAB1075590.1 hypothetical protein F6X51_02600 [Methylobacterium planeticum]
MRVLGRLLLLCLALVLAVPAGALMLGLALVLDPAAQAWLAGGALAGLDATLSDLAAGMAPETMLLALAGIAQALAVLLVAPPVLVALVGETLRLRTLAWYAGGAGLLSAALPWLARGGAGPGGAERLAAEGHLSAILFLAGAAAGLVYWLVAGRSAAEPAGAA